MVSEGIEQLVLGLQSLNTGEESLDPTIVTSYKPATKTDLDIDQELKARFLTPNSEISWNILDLIQRKAEPLKIPFYDGLLSVPEPTKSVSFQFKRRGIEGKIESYKEQIDFSKLSGGDGNNSLSLTRQSGAKSEYVRGKSSSLPFAPGGITLGEGKDKKLEALRLLHRDKDGLFDFPEGLPRGLEISDEAGIEALQELELELDSRTDASEEIEDQVMEEIIPEANFSNTTSEQTDEIDALLPDEILISKSQTAQTIRRKEWAHVVDLNHTIDNFHDLVPNMAREWPFELDTFQKEAVYHLEQNDSVFVAAHTSAGKTVVAEYAIAMANRNMTKAIYTSPIKALSNQKFRDFKEDFDDLDVGLITGDVQINSTANCLIMTTEILRSMLYRGADLIRDVEFVIFDEVHYVNDVDRGVVWEEVIIMLPPHVKFILLSATVPNTFEFANWVGRTKQKDIYVISTPKRPVPLEIFGWAKGNTYKLIDSDRKYLEDGFKQLKSKLEGGSSTSNARGGRGGKQPAPVRGVVRGSARGVNRGGGRGARGGARGGANRGNTGKMFMKDFPNKRTWLDLVQFLKKRDLLPVVVFVFSRKRCEEYIATLTSIDYTTAREKSEIHRFVEGAISRLKREDRTLPQILNVREMLSRGIAVHHGGLLPIIKEIIEILFAKTLIKVLFATETFAMGLNLPTRTVVFSETRKHDGRNFRDLLPGEFTQMSGRAGRRGLDKTGTVIVMTYNHPMDPMSFKEITLGTPTKLQSQFRLTYNMILNLLRIEALRVEEMIKNSFSENTNQNMISDHMENAKKLSAQIASLKVDENELNLDEIELLQDLYSKFSEYKSINTEIIQQAAESPALKRKFSKGTLVVFREANGRLRPGFILSIANKSLNLLQLGSGKSAAGNDPAINSIPYLSMVPGFIDSLKLPKFEANENYKKVKVPFEQIELVTRVGISDPGSDISSSVKIMLKYQTDWHETNWGGISSLAFHELLKRKNEIISNLIEDKRYVELMNHKHFRKNYKIIYQKTVFKEQLKDAQMTISGENLELLPDYNARLAVLKDLEFVDFNLNVLLKGRVACEINSGWELIVTELILDNFLGDFEPEEIVALFSCFVYEGKAKMEEVDPFLTPRLEKGAQRIREIVGNVLTVYGNHQVGLTSEEEEFLDRKRFALVNVVYEWARGMSFSKIMEISPEPEGSIVRVITRLDEVCREVKNASSIIGNSLLHAKMTDSQEKIKRDIVFCASLYL